MKQEYIQFAPLFAGLADDEKDALADGFVQEKLGASAMLFKAGDRADGLYLVGTGFVRLVTPSGINLATLGPGSVLGEDSLFRNLPYDVSAQAVSELEYWKLSDRALRQMIVDRPAIGIRLSQNFGSLIAQMQDYLIQRLAGTKELESVPRHTLQTVADHLEPRWLAANQYLFKAGDPPGGLFLIEEGTLETQGEVQGEKRILHPGELLGTFSLLASKPQPNDVVAAEESMLWMLSVDDFQTINSRQPGLRRSLGHSVRARLSRNDQSLAVQRLRQMPIFGELPPHVIQAMAQRMVLQHVPAGERVYRIGEGGDAVYLIESGEIELTAENAVGVLEEIGRIGADGYFGEMSLLTGQIRTEDATATRNSNLWVLSRSDLDELATRYADIGRALSAGVATRLASDGFRDESQLRQFLIFADLGPSDLHQVAAMLRPMRYRAGEQIFRASMPADKLFLIEKGQVRVQPLGGAAWQLGTGQSFGERAILTNQPHNSSVIADTDVDVWTLAKADFDLLMNRYPTIAISMSRMLSERLGQLTTQSNLPPVGAGPGAPPPTLPSAATPVAVAPAQRRRDAAAGSMQAPSRQRQSFGQWYGGLSGFGKLRFALLILLLILLLCVSVPFTLYTIINGASAAAAILNRALTGVYAKGSYEVAAADSTFADSMRLADALVPPTPTYTPYPTSTPQPTHTPQPTNTPIPTATFAPQPALQTFADVAAFAAEEPEAPSAPEGESQAPAAPPRALDSRLGQLGVGIDEAQVSPGQQYWRLVEARWEDEQQAGGKHHIYVDVLDENGDRIVGQPVTVFWGDGNYTGPVEDKQAPDLGFNYQMYAAGYAYNIKVEGLPSDVVKGAGMGDLANRFKGIHVAYYLVFQRQTK